MNSTFRVCRPLVDDALLTSSSNESLIQEYLSWKQSYTKAAYSRYKIWVLRFQEFANKPPELLAHTDYVAFAHSLKQNYAPSCIQFALSIVHNYLRFFWEQGRIRFPLYLARVPRASVESHAAITEGEYRKSIELLRSKKAPPLRDLVIVMLLHDTGLRVGELLSLEIEDLEEDCSAVVRTEKTTRNRRVFWNKDTEEVLQRYLIKRVNYGPAKTDSDMLFISDYSTGGKPITSRTVQRMLKEVLRSAGISRKLCPHSFRHAFIHRLAKLGVPDAIIAQLVGHSTPNTIAHYTKLSRPEFKEYAQKQLGVDGIESLALAA